MANSLDEYLKEPTNAAAWAEFGRQVPSGPKRTLFHYTSLLGFHGIVSSRSLWATDANFLNDPSEIRYARNVIDEAVSTVRDRFSSTVARDVFDFAVKSSFETSEGFDFFLASFSERDDLLTQWIAYTPAAAGVSLGIRPAFLRKLGETWVRRVLYSKDKQLSLVTHILDQYRVSFEKATEPLDLVQFGRFEQRDGPLPSLRTSLLQGSRVRARERMAWDRFSGVPARLCKASGVYRRVGTIC